MTPRIQTWLGVLESLRGILKPWIETGQGKGLWCFCCPRPDRPAGFVLMLQLLCPPQSSSLITALRSPQDWGLGAARTSVRKRTAQRTTKDRECAHPFSSCPESLKRATVERKEGRAGKGCTLQFYLSKVESGLWGSHIGLWISMEFSKNF